MEAGSERFILNGAENGAAVLKDGDKNGKEIPSGRRKTAYGSKRFRLEPLGGCEVNALEGPRQKSVDRLVGECIK